ncbi:MAG: chemotaxis protein CheD [Planctomycetota bacterium]
MPLEELLVCRDSQGAAGRLIVGIADMKIASPPAELIVTHALGSCIGLTAYDPTTRVGGMLHFMLPAPTAGSEVDNPARYGMTGIPALFRALYAKGANKQNLIVCAAGGSRMLGNGSEDTRIGERNHLILRKLLWKNGIQLSAEDTGGTHSRTMTLHLATGEVIISNAGTKEQLYPAA